MPGSPSPRMLVMCHNPSSAAAESFRMLRTNLQFLGADRPLKSILVTSSSPGEGKSMIAANLAVAFAQAGSTVAVVDADLRHPVLAPLFEIETGTGLTSALAGSVALDRAIRATSVDGVWLLPSGPLPPNPAELLGSHRMAEILDKLGARFGLVVVDSAPVLAVTDPAVIAPRVDGVLLVVRAGATSHFQAAAARDALRGVKARILGVVLDRAKTRPHAGFYYYYSRARSR